MHVFDKRYHIKNEFPGFGFFPAASSSAPELLSALIPLVVIANAEKHNYHKNQTIQMQATKTAIYVVHPKVGLRPPSIGIGLLIIQLMEITDTLSDSLSLYGHTII